MIDLTALPAEDQAVILAKRAYKKAWREKNKDKVKASNERFYKKLAAKIAEEQTKEKPPE